MKSSCLTLALFVSQSLGWVPSVRLQNRRGISPEISSTRPVPLYMSTAEGIDFTTEEDNLLKDILAQSTDLTAAVREALPTLPPRLIVKLRQSTNNPNPDIQMLAKALESILDAELVQAKETLQTLLTAGEIRKLDSLIGKYAREGKLNVAFFNVLGLNLQEASKEGAGEGTASQAQILQHVYTRCQEEVEKNIPPGTALLNKLLRTQEAPIRANIYQHYLTPQPNTITTPDGKEVELKGEKPVMVSLEQFVDAIAASVKQIRMVEQAGGTDRVMAANMVESVRQVAKEARSVIGDSYGRDSEQVRELEEGLQPVFRPSSPDSPYIQGE